MASCGAALPSPSDTASEPTVEAPQPYEAVAAESVGVVCLAPVVALAWMNQNRWIVAS